MPQYGPLNYNPPNLPFDPWAMPNGMPDYVPAYDPNTMAMTDDISARLKELGPDTSGLRKFRSEAMRTGPSAWAALAHQQQAFSTDTARARGAQEVAGQRAGAESALAMRGGLSSGARERVAKSGARDYLNMSQDVSRQQDLNNLQIGANDEQNRVQQLGMVPGMENANAGIGLDQLKLYGQSRQLDNSNAIGESRAKNNFNLDRYHEQMAGWGANQQANATANSGKK